MLDTTRPLRARTACLPVMRSTSLPLLTPFEKALQSGFYREACGAGKKHVY
jgi:hypothetical protein